ncbi:leucine--tRNA ligase [Flavobacteriaceae bacterium LMO-SS05]
MKYHFNEIEKKWQDYWAKNKTFKAENPALSGVEGQSDKPKYYVLDMFPYPSGAGLHVGHPLGYIASDIYARYKRHKGFNVLHPQGYDSFGLPAEQYAIQTGQHPALTTEENIKTYRRQLDQIGFSFDWSREVRTSDPKYYKWTQWVFIQLFESWYNRDTNKAESISDLEKIFASNGNSKVNAACDDDTETFSAEDWNQFSSKKQQEILLKYRLTYLAEAEVNWCPALGTVLANDEVVNGVSERGGHPVIRKKMTQWMMRISAYAERLLQGLETIDWPEPLKDMQRYWIGKSVGASVTFKVLPPGKDLGWDNILSPALSKGKGAKHAGYLTGNPNNAHLLLERAKDMRANPTKAEAALWQHLKSKKINVKFRQQHLIEDYIVDFVCLSKQLIVEVDGKIHEFQVEEDSNRTEVLENKGFKVIRFTNEEVLGNIDSVISRIQKELRDREAYFLETNESPSLEDDLGIDESPSLGEGFRMGIDVFTTRPDTIFGVSFMTLAPEHELVAKITTPEQKAEVEAYIEATAKRSELDRMADVKTITGAFTGAYVEHPFTKQAIPVWIGDYVLAGYGTGAVMSVPCGDQRDYDFANHFNIPIPNIFEGVDISQEAFSDKDKTIIANSDFLNGLEYKQATKKSIEALEKIGQGKGKTNFRLRDAVFSRQRYWGEPFPVYYVNGMPQMIDVKHLPIELPEVEKYLPTQTGEPPLGNATTWAWDLEKCSVVSNQLIDHKTVFPLELNTMPGWAGSSQYFNRYMDPHNEDEIFSQKAINYWQQVDLYIGGSEHATGHLLYSRFWQKFMFDKGLAPHDEFAKKLINQGMILGTSAFVYRVIPHIGLFNDEALKNSINYKNFEKGLPTILHSKYLIDEYFKIENKSNFEKDKFIEIKKIYQKFNNCNLDLSNISIEFQPIHADVSFVNASDELDIDAFKNWRPEFKEAEFICEDDNTFKVGREVEKMSKSKYNVVNPDQICHDYGADSLRLYEMFLGPLEQAKPWNTAGITGVHGFLKKLWKLYFDDNGFKVSNDEPTKENLKTLHKTIKKVEDDIEHFSFNTSVSTFMIAVNELTAQHCNSKAILEPLLIVISPYAPHIAEELWEALGHNESIALAPFPKFEASYLVESSKTYPISFNGKTRFTLELPLDLSKEDIEAAVMAHEKTKSQLEGRTPKKVIIVPGKIVNIVG